MFNVIKRHKIAYIVEAIVAIIIFSISLEAFLIYAFVMLLIKLDMVTDYLRKLIRVTQVANEVKLSAIVKKLKITDEELDKNMVEVKSNTGEAAWESLEQDLKDIQGLK